MIKIICAIASVCVVVLLCGCSGRGGTVSLSSMGSGFKTSNIGDHAVIEDHREASALASVRISQFADNFLTHLKQGLPLAPLLKPEIVFIFHSDNRCTGNTDGTLRRLSAAQIDTTFKVPVTNDGDAWGCAKNAPSTFEIEFNLQKRLATWERIELASESDRSEYFVIEGQGQSDYLVVSVEIAAEQIAAYKIEYRSEDPG